MSAPHVQRCTVTQRFGEGRHANWWQCRLTDPHPGGPDQAHDFGVDAEVYGRDLNLQSPEWLAAQLRDAEARARHQQRRIAELTAIAGQLGDLAARGIPVSADTAKWVAANRPDISLNLSPQPWFDGWVAP